MTNVIRIKSLINNNNYSLERLPTSATQQKTTDNRMSSCNACSQVLELVKQIYSWVVGIWWIHDTIEWWRSRPTSKKYIAIQTVCNISVAQLATWEPKWPRLTWFFVALSAFIGSFLLEEHETQAVILANHRNDFENQEPVIGNND